jgi:hypothetical protein
VLGLTLAGIPLALLMMLVSIYQLWRLLDSLNLGPEGQRLLRTNVTLKGWVAAFLTYVFVGTVIGGTPVEVRRVINLLLVAGLIAQVCYAIATFRRWRVIRGEQQQAVARRVGGIPDVDD